MKDVSQASEMPPRYVLCWPKPGTVGGAAVYLAFAALLLLLAALPGYVLVRQAGSA